jgi:hypothetical protein
LIYPKLNSLDQFQDFGPDLVSLWILKIGVK